MSQPNEVDIMRIALRTFTLNTESAANKIGSFINSTESHDSRLKSAYRLLTGEELALPNHSPTQDKFVYLLQLRNLKGSMVVIASTIVGARDIASSSTGNNEWQSRNDCYVTRLGMLFGGVHIAETVICKDIDRVEK